VGSCRETYFYTSPGTRRRFDAVTLATCTTEGEFAVFTHRKDLERYEAAHPAWDHICYVGPTGGPASLISALRDHPENVERCWLDKHITNGRRPKAAEHTLFNLTTRGVAKAGGVAAVLGLFPHASPSLRCQVEALARARGGYGLSVALGLREYLGDAALARIMARFNVPGLVFAPPDVTEVREFASMVARCYGPERATAVLSALSELPEEWREWMSLDPRTAATELATLSRDRSVSVRGNVARMVLCPVSVLETLSRDRSSYVRRYVAGNIHTPEDILVPVFYFLLNNRNVVL
jgi:hypothetical protein